MKDEGLVAQLVQDYRQAPLEERDRAMLDYAVMLTRTPWEAGEAALQRLRAHGFTDRDILDITMITGYFNYTNRVAQALGIHP